MDVCVARKDFTLLPTCRLRTEPFDMSANVRCTGRRIFYVEFGCPGKAIAYAKFYTNIFEKYSAQLFSVAYLFVYRFVLLLSSFFS